MEVFNLIASRAQYISDVASAIAIQNSNSKTGIVDTALLIDIYLQLANISNTLDEYHNWDEEE